MNEKKKKKDISAGGWGGGGGGGGVSKFFLLYVDITDFQLQYGGTFLWANLEQKQQRWQQNQIL